MILIAKDSMSTVLLAVAFTWEPGTRGLLDVGDLSIMLGFAVAAAGVLIKGWKKWNRLLREMMREEITVATEPIHPASNGGFSLADVAKRTQRLEDTMIEMRAAQSEVKDLLLRVLAHSLADSKSERNK